MHRLPRPRARDPTSESLQPIQSARTEDDLRAAFREHNRSRRAYSTTRAGNDDDTLSLIPGMKFCFPVSTIQRLRR